MLWGVNIMMNFEDMLEFYKSKRKAKELHNAHSADVDNAQKQLSEQDMDIEWVSSMLELLQNYPSKAQFDEMEEVVTTIQNNLSSENLLQVYNGAIERIAREEGVTLAKHEFADIFEFLGEMIYGEHRPIISFKDARVEIVEPHSIFDKIKHRQECLKRLEELGAPEVILENERRMLKEAMSKIPKVEEVVNSTHSLGCKPLAQRRIPNAAVRRKSYHGKFCAHVAEHLGKIMIDTATTYQELLKQEMIFGEYADKVNQDSTATFKPSSNYHKSLYNAISYCTKLYGNAEEFLDFANPAEKPKLIDIKGVKTYHEFGNACTHFLVYSEYILKVMQAGIINQRNHIVNIPGFISEFFEKLEEHTKAKEKLEKELASALEAQKKENAKMTIPMPKFDIEFEGEIFSSTSFDKISTEMAIKYLEEIITENMSDECLDWMIKAVEERARLLKQGEEVPPISLPRSKKRPQNNTTEPVTLSNVRQKKKKEVHIPWQERVEHRKYTQEFHDCLAKIGEPSVSHIKKLVERIPSAAHEEIRGFKNEGIYEDKFDEWRIFFTLAGNNTLKIRHVENKKSLKGANDYNRVGNMIRRQLEREKSQVK